MGVPAAIEDAWVVKQKNPPQWRAVADGGDFKRICNCLFKKMPRELPKTDSEKSPLVNEGVSGESKGFFLREDGTMAPKKSYYSEIVAHDLLWWKIRAWLSTVCYLTILEPDFFLFRLVRILATCCTTSSLRPCRVAPSSPSGSARSHGNA